MSRGGGSRNRERILRRRSLDQAPPLSAAKHVLEQSAAAVRGGRAAAVLDLGEEGLEVAEPDLGQAPPAQSGQEVVAEALAVIVPAALVAPHVVEIARRQLGNVQLTAGLLPGGLRVDPLADLGEPRLRQAPGLVDGQVAEVAKAEKALGSPGVAVGHDECLAPRRVDADAEALEPVVPAVVCPAARLGAGELLDGPLGDVHRGIHGNQTATSVEEAGAAVQKSA